MLRLSRAVLSYFCLFFTLMPVLNRCVQPIYAAEHELEGTTPSPIPPESINEARELTLETSSSHTFSFKDVYQIDLNLDVPGDIQFVATEGEEVNVVLEKRAQATNTEQDIAIRTYLDNISVRGTHDDTTLQLKVQLPGGEGSQAGPNPFFGVQNLQALSQQLQLKCIVKAPADVSVKLQSKIGNVRLQGIRGQIQITTAAGDVHLNETLGNYDVTLTNGDIKGKILLTRGQSKLETKNGAIDLTLLDSVAAPMDLTGTRGEHLITSPTRLCY